MKKTPKKPTATAKEAAPAKTRAARAATQASGKEVTAKKASAKRPTAQQGSAKRRTAKPAPPEKATAKRAPPKKRTAKPAPPAKAAVTSAATKPASKKPASRADLGAPIDGFFAKQPAHLRAILVALRELVEEAAPDATSSIKWGMPFYDVNGAMMCALGAHRSHVNLILWGPPGAFADPEGRLSGAGKTGRHLKLTAPGQLPRDAVRRWLRVAADLAREKNRTRPR